MGDFAPVEACMERDVGVEGCRARVEVRGTSKRLAGGLAGTPTPKPGVPGAPRRLLRRAGRGVGVGRSRGTTVARARRVCVGGGARACRRVWARGLGGLRLARAAPRVSEPAGCADWSAWRCGGARGARPEPWGRDRRVYLGLLRPGSRRAGLVGGRGGGAALPGNRAGGGPRGGREPASGRRSACAPPRSQVELAVGFVPGRRGAPAPRGLFFFWEVEINTMTGRKTSALRP